MKPRLIEITIERVVDAGPVTLGISDIKLVQGGVNGSTVHAASVVVTAMMVGGPANARAFQLDVVRMFEGAHKAALDAEKSADASLPEAESTAPPAQE